MRGSAGVALVLVLAVSTLVCLVVLALTFTVTLDSLAARNAQQHALAEGEAEGALALGAMAARSAPGSAAWTPPMRLGPWPEYGIAATVDVAEDGEGALWLTARAEEGKVRLRRRLVLALSPDAMQIRLRE